MRGIGPYRCLSCYRRTTDSTKHIAGAWTGGTCRSYRALWTGGTTTSKFGDDNDASTAIAACQTRRRCLKTNGAAATRAEVLSTLTTSVSRCGRIYRSSAPAKNTAASSAVVALDTRDSGVTI